MGNGVPRRRVLHKALAKKAVAGKEEARAGTRPIAVLLIGTPGSGKTTEGMKHAQTFKANFVVINADDLKESLPEYRGWNAAALHEESSYIAEKLIYSKAIENRNHILFDLTGANERKMLGMVDHLDRMGYEIHVILVSIPAWMAVGRVWRRFCEKPLHKDPNFPSGRFVPPEYVYNDVGDRPAKTYAMLKEHPAVKSWTSLSTAVRPVQLLDMGRR